MGMRGYVALIAVALFTGWAGPVAGQEKSDAQATSDTTAVNRQVDTQNAAESSCVSCHGGLPDERLSKPVEQFEGDVHASKGFTCVVCHGGDATEMSMDAMDPKRGFIGVPSHQQIPLICGRCHSDAEFMKQYNPSLRVDQVAEYRTSVHGQRLFQLDDPKVATCASCHTAHSIKPPSDPNSTVYAVNVASTCGACHADSAYMASYDISTNQLAQYKKSIHWQTLSVQGDLSAPTCNDCHGNHGAAPPGISWVGNVCGRCHTVMEDLFSKSVHSEAFTLLGSPGCVTCHSNHDIETVSDTMLGLGEGAVCARCHGASDPGGKAAAEMRLLIDSLNTEYQQASSILARAENAGVEVSQAQFQLGDVKSALVKARTMVHAFVVDSVETTVDTGLVIAAEGVQRGHQALREVQFRRAGLTVSVIIIVLLIVGLVIKIRELS